jgi:transposase
MHSKQNYIYVGIDLHKETHTAVIINCWNETLGEITIENRPSEFIKLIRKVSKYCKDGLIPVFGLENAYGYGRSLAVWLLENGYVVKDVNPALSYAQRKSAPMTKKDDSYDAYCVAVILLNQLNELPDAKPEDSYWTLAQLVNRRENVVIEITRLKNQLHEQLVHSYPSYRKFFSIIDRPTALYFWETYPSLIHLKGVTPEKLAEELRPISHNNCSVNRAKKILDAVGEDGDTSRDHQEVRDFITRKLVKDLEHKNGELTELNAELEKMMKLFDCKLTTIQGVDTVTAAKLLAEIGDINRFSNADKLARFAGIAPVKFSSAGKGKEEKSKQGNRTLHGIFYFMAVQMVQTSRGSNIPRNPVFHEYFVRKIAEGKTKPQALVCIMRRLVNIIYGMLKNKTEYRMSQLPSDMDNVV